MYDEKYILLCCCNHFFYSKRKAQAWYIHAIIVTNNPGPCSLAGTWQDDIKAMNIQYNTGQLNNKWFERTLHNLIRNVLVIKHWEYLYYVPLCTTPPPSNTVLSKLPWNIFIIIFNNITFEYSLVNGIYYIESYLENNVYLIVKWKGKSNN